MNRVCGRGGVLLVPAFAVGRAQALMLAGLRASGTIPPIPTFLNSPMAIDAAHIFCDHPGDHRLPPHECEHTRDIEASKALNAHGGPMMILIAGSGMATGGRILHHLKSYGPDPTNGVLLVGYQAAGPEVLRCATAPRPSGSTATTCPSTPSGRRSTGCRGTRTGRSSWRGSAPTPDPPSSC